MKRFQRTTTYAICTTNLSRRGNTNFTMLTGAPVAYARFIRSFSSIAFKRWLLRVGRLYPLNIFKKIFSVIVQIRDASNDFAYYIFFLRNVYCVNIQTDANAELYKRIYKVTLYF